MLRGSRVQLRPWRDDDVAFFQLLRSDVQTQIALMAHPRPSSGSAARDWLECRSRDSDGRFFVLSIPSTDEAVGFIELRELSALHRHAALGVCLARKFRGQGLAFEAVELMHEYARDVAAVRKIVLEVIESHSRAVRLYERLGYERAGRLREHFYYAGRHHDVLVMEKFLLDSFTEHLPWT